jgi:hypothetical protein
VRTIFVKWLTFELLKNLKLQFGDRDINALDIELNECLLRFKSAKLIEFLKMRLRPYLIVGMLFVLLLSSITDGRRGKGARRRGKMRKQGSPRFLFYTNPRRREYYDNPNVRIFLLILGFSQIFTFIVILIKRKLQSLDIQSFENFFVELIIL